MEIKDDLLITDNGDFINLKNIATVQFGSNLIVINGIMLGGLRAEEKDAMRNGIYLYLSKKK